MSQLYDEQKHAKSENKKNHLHEKTQQSGVDYTSMKGSGLIELYGVINKLSKLPQNKKTPHQISQLWMDQGAGRLALLT